MMPNNWDHWVWEVDCGQDVGADTSMKLHLVKFGSGQLAGFVKDIFRHSKLAHVVQECSRLDSLDLIFHPQIPSRCARPSAYA